jgi:hypothetical protein
MRQVPRIQYCHRPEGQYYHQENRETHLSAGANVVIPHGSLQYRVSGSTSRSLMLFQTGFEFFQFSWSHYVLVEHLGQHGRHEWWKGRLNSVVLVQSGEDTGTVRTSRC